LGSVSRLGNVVSLSPTYSMTAFALAVIDPKTQALCASFVSDLRDEAVSFDHLPRQVAEALIGQFCPNVNLFGQKGPALAISSPLDRTVTYRLF